MKKEPTQNNEVHFIPAKKSVVKLRREEHSRMRYKLSSLLNPKSISKESKR
tara:strand:- start:8484 stop:8636 length:153 start_codon:yes stop_codon:yes gene_type:complete